jgi:23S rRNA (uridine2552-2'-O)-methyltransferase
MARSKSSHRWLTTHSRDIYVRKAQEMHFRSRAAFKLQGIQDRDRLLRAGQVVVDLGAAPGGWSQFAAQIVGEHGRIFALDLLPVEPIPGVVTVQGDFREPVVLDELSARVGQSRADVVLSDMAPNLSGLSAVDQPRSIALCELVQEFAEWALRPGGSLCVKVFQGVGMEQLVRQVRASFGKVWFRKPQASRAQSREMYLLARNYNL